MKNKTTCGVIAHWLIIIGALNWGLVGLGYLFGGNWNIVNILLGQWMVVENIVYLLVGASAIATILGCKDCKCGGSQM